MVRMTAAHLRRQRRGGVPAFDPLGPYRVGAFDVGGVVVTGAHGWIAVTQLGDRPLQRIQHRPLMPVGRRMRSQHVERRVASSSSRGLRLSSRAWLNTPRIRLLVPLLMRYPHRSSTSLGAAHRLIHRGLTKYQAGQVKSIEHAQAMEVGEPAEQVRQSHDERSHRRLGRQRLRGDELAGAAAAQPRPLPRRPAPPAAAGVGAVLQHDRRRVRYRAAVTLTSSP